MDKNSKNTKIKKKTYRNLFKFFHKESFPEKLSLVLFIFLISFTVAVLYFMFISDTPYFVKGDFISYLTGGLMVREGFGKLIYDLDAQFAYQLEVLFPYDREILLPYKSLPFVGTLFIPLTYPPVISSFKIFSLVNLILLVTIYFFLKKMFPKKTGNKIWLYLPFVFPPVTVVLAKGQITFVLVLILIGIYKSIKLKRAFVGGLLSGMLFIKPQYIILAPFMFLLVKEKKRFLFGFLLSTSLLTAWSLYVSGINNLINYPLFVFNTENPAYGSISEDMFTIYPLILHLSSYLKVGRYIPVLINGLLYLLLFVYFVAKTEGCGVDKLFVSAILISVVLSVHALDHDLSILMLPIYILINLGAKQTKLYSFYAKILFLIPLFGLIGHCFIGGIAMLTIVFLITNKKFGAFLLVNKQ